MMKSLSRLAAAALAVLSLTVAIEAADQPAVDLTPEKVTIDGREMFSLGFDKLSSFDYLLVDAGTGATPEEIAERQKQDPVPKWVHTYDNQRVVLLGYLMPLQVEGGITKKFVLMRDVNTCCYGAVPNMNDYVIVTMKGDGVPTTQDIPVQVVGIFHIDHRYQDGYVVSLFTLDGEKYLGQKKG